MLFNSKFVINRYIFLVKPNYNENKLHCFWKNIVEISKKIDPIQKIELEGNFWTKRQILLSSQLNSSKCPEECLHSFEFELVHERVCLNVFSVYVCVN